MTHGSDRGKPEEREWIKAIGRSVLLPHSSNSCGRNRPFLLAIPNEPICVLCAFIQNIALAIGIPLPALKTSPILLINMLPQILPYTQTFAYSLCLMTSWALFAP
ncbi:hypothetical protein F4777DRAFT_531263 [Nemania sp. FL0916]|nr:hypothetical protein F4777DRAFT_531263 [Nemania sp. FL0916]